MGKHAYGRSYTSAQGRHRRPSDSRSITRHAMTAGGLTVGALVVGQLAAPAAFAASGDDFARLRMCESGGNYQTDTGNGYYGAYQFSLGTWHGIGYSGKPSDAAPSTQDAAAHQLQARSGWGQWPACSRKLGLGSSHSHQTSSSPARQFTAASTSHAVVVHPASGPLILTTDFAGVWRADVRDLQTKLKMVGFGLKIDGHYGQETATVIHKFQENTGLTVDGQVGPETQTMLQRQLVAVAHLMALTARV
jgi:hypothetical protein